MDDGNTTWGVSVQRVVSESVNGQNVRPIYRPPPDHPVNIETMPGAGMHCVYHLYAHAPWYKEDDDGDMMGPIPYGCLDVPESSMIYVGVTSNLKRRLREHSLKWWWPVVASIEIDPYPDRQTANYHERQDIRLYQPELNVADRFATRLEPDPKPPFDYGDEEPF